MSNDERTLNNDSPKKREDGFWTKAFQNVPSIVVGSLLSLGASYATFQYQSQTSRAQALADKRYSELKDLVALVSRQTPILMKVVSVKRKSLATRSSGNIKREEYAALFRDYLEATQELQAWISEYSMRAQLVSALLKSSLPSVPPVEVFFDGEALDLAVQYSGELVKQRLLKMEESCSAQLAALQQTNIEFQRTYPKAVAATTQ